MLKNTLLKCKINKFLFLPLALLMNIAVIGIAQAGPVMFFGEDLGLGENIRLPSTPNADAARTSLFSNLTGVGTESFEAFAAGTGSGLIANFGGGLTATLTGSGRVNNIPTGTNGVGRYPISGNQYWETGSGFSLSFSQDVSAFGFYGTDIGDFGGQVTVTYSNGITQLTTIPNTINGTGGGALYFGFFDLTKPFNKIDFGNTASGTDFFGFDDFSIGTLAQVTSDTEPVPEPTTMALFGMGLVGLVGAAARRKFKKKELVKH